MKICVRVEDLRKSWAFAWKLNICVKVETYALKMNIFDRILKWIEKVNGWMVGVKAALRVAYSNQKRWMSDAANF